MKKSEDSTATYMAKILLDFHASFVWISPLDPDQSSSGKRKHATKPRARYEDKRRKRNQGSCPSRPVSTCQASGINHTRVGLLQQEEQESGDSIQGAVSSQDPTQLNTLPLSTCSPNLSQARSVEKPTMNIIPSQPPGEETLLDIAALDYAGPQCSISDNGNDHSNALGFVAPLLNMSCLDFVDPQFSFYPPLYSFEQNVPPAQNQD